MSQFDVYRTGDDRTLLVNCQSDFVSDLPTRFVIPLIPVAQAPLAAERFNPHFSIEGAEYQLVPQYASSVRTKDLVATGHSLASEYERVTAAIDFLVGGF